MGGAVKLVRDRIPELATSNGQPAPFHQADPAEYARLLRDKLLEEAAEAASASSPAALLEELGDVLQVLYALASQAGLEPAATDALAPTGPQPRQLHPPGRLARPSLREDPP
jgi:predicted house-cleaning noncanonical NTP pyrophosphatase (MazG superfamily)